jgi:hypothetical protein
MKTNRLIWGFVSLLVLITVVVWSGFFPSRGQERIVKKTTRSTPAPVRPDNRDLSKYGSVQYDSPEAAAPNEERWFANQRYDNQGWVFKTVSPPAGGVGKITHDPLSPALPVEGSSLIVAGEVVAVNTFLSNDRRGVYTEFVISPDDVLKDSDKVSSNTIRADREGGVVIYPNGLRFLYQNSTLALPKLGGKYLFFLTKKGESPNYEICTAYDMGGEKAYRLESDGNFDESKQPVKSQLLDEVRKKIAQFI